MPFLNKPTFAFHPERQAIGFDLGIRLTINGTIRVDALDPISDFFFGINGTYPLIVVVNNLRLTGDAQLFSTYADASRIQFSLNSQPGLINVSDNGSTTAPNEVKVGVRTMLRRQLSQPLRQSFIQRYDHFALAGLSLTPNTPQATSRLRYTYRSLPETAQPILHVVARSIDGKLYHLRKTEGGGSVIGSVQPLPSLRPRITSDPSLVGSASDQLELAAVTSQAQLVYTHWRDGRWINHRTFGPGLGGPPGGYVGKPALAVSAPGQVEIVVAASGNGALWHIRKRNGVWLPPARIPIFDVPGVREAPYRDPVALVTGNKVLLLFVDNQSRLQAMAYDLESGMWGQASHIPTGRFVRHAPAATASGNGYVDVVYIGTDTVPYHRLFQIRATPFAPNVGQTGISLIGSETSIGGSVSTTPSIVCSSYRQLELIARGTDNRLYHNHFAGPASPTGLWDGRQLTAGWQGWTDLNGNFAGTLTFEVMGGFSAAVTRTGKVEIAAIRRPSLLNRGSDQPIVHNSYLSDRFAHAPWKTITWRGYEQFDRHRFVGSPAIALGDPNIPLAYVDNNLKLQGHQPRRR